MTNAALLQRDYYFNTAAHYDAMHVSGDDEHSVALQYVSALVREFGIETMLDVGTGFHFVLVDGVTGDTFDVADPHYLDPVPASWNDLSSAYGNGTIAQAWRIHSR